MNLKTYYQNLRQVEAGLTEPNIVIFSLPTPDGGREGVCTEVPRGLAARMIVESSARLATEAEASAYREQMAEARRAAEQAAVASRIQVTVVAEPPEEIKKRSKSRTSPE